MPLNFQERNRINLNLKRRDRIYGIAVDEDGEYRNIRRMPHGRHVVNGRLKPESNFGTKTLRYVKKYFIRYVRQGKTDFSFRLFRRGIFICFQLLHPPSYRGKVYFLCAE